MGFFSFITEPLGDVADFVVDDVAGFDPGGGGVFGVARDVLGDDIADDFLGFDPNGGGIVPLTNTAARLAAAYLAGDAIGAAAGFNTPVFGAETAANAANAASAGSGLEGLLSTSGETASSASNLNTLFGTNSTPIPDAFSTFGSGATNATSVPDFLFNAAPVAESTPGLLSQIGTFAQQNQVPLNLLSRGLGSIAQQQQAQQQQAQQAANAAAGRFVRPQSASYEQILRSLGATTSTQRRV